MKRRTLILFPLLAALLPRPAESAQWSVPKDAPGIQAAVDRAESGDTVLVQPGTWKGRVVIKPGVVLRSAAGAKKTIIDGGGAAAKQPGVTLAEGATLDGFTVTGMGAYDDAAWKKHHATKGEEQSHDHIGEFGAPAVGATGINCVIVNNIVHHNGFTGIGLSGTNGVPLVENNACYRNMGGGIGIMDGCTAVVRGNTCYENFYAGIGHDASHPLVVSNVCYGNIRAGIGISHGACPVVVSNVCFQNRRAGIGIRTGADTRPLVVGNNCYGNAMAGIGTREGAAPFISGNRCHKNEMAGIGSRLDAQPTIEGNSVFENKLAGIGFMACRSGRAVLSGNRVYKNGMVAVGIHKGWTVRLVKNELSTLQGLPPVVMVFKGAKAVFTDNRISGPGVAGVRVGGTVVLSGNTLDGVKPRKGGPPHFGVWVLDGGKAELRGNRFSNWRKDVHRPAPPK